MLNDDFLAQARQAVFGEPPCCRKALVGYHVSVNYFDYILIEAEAVLLKLQMPRHTLPICLRHAFDFPSHPSFAHFPRETVKVIEDCANRFRQRYARLADPETIKAA